MKTYAGIWVDYKKALVSVVSSARLADPAVDWSRPDSVTLKKIASGVESRVRPSGGAGTRGTPYGPQDVADEKKLDARRHKQLKAYYEKIMTLLKNADHVLIFGPADAKWELKKTVEAAGKNRHPEITVEAADKMTDNQVKARIRSFYADNAAGR